MTKSHHIQWTFFLTALVGIAVLLLLVLLLKESKSHAGTIKEHADEISLLCKQLEDTQSLHDQAIAKHATMIDDLYEDLCLHMVFTPKLETERLDALEKENAVLKKSLVSLAEQVNKDITETHNLTSRIMNLLRTTRLLHEYLEIVFKSSWYCDELGVGFVSGPNNKPWNIDDFDKRFVKLLPAIKQQDASTELLRTRLTNILNAITTIQQDIEKLNTPEQPEEPETQEQ